jgi:hypothetical protein
MDVLQSDCAKARPVGSALAALALCAFAPFAASAQSGPTYISSMAPFEVRAMTGTYAPTNGKATMQSVTPSEWLSGDPGTLDLRGVVDAWSGGAKSVGAKLFVTGGGHNDSANNGLYTFDFSGTDAPTGWEAPIISPVSAVRSGQTTYSDGKPSAIHTYDGVVYASHNNHIYRFNGVYYLPAGGFTNATFKLNVATGTWTQLANYPGGPGSGTTIYDPVTKKIFVSKQEVTTGYFFRTTDDTWSSGKGYGGSGISTDTVGAWDSKRGRGIIVGNNRNYLVTVNFSAETVSLGSLPASGATILNRAGLSAFYDPVADVYWIFGGESGSAGYTNIYEMNAQTFVITQHALSQSIGTGVSGDNQGTFGRFVFMDNWRAIGIVTAVDRPAYVIKLPGTAAVAPEAPTALTAN